LKTVKAPDPARQYERTPIWIRRYRRSIVEGGEVVVQERQFLTEGTGLEARVLRWHELRDRVEDFVQNRALLELKGLYKALTDEDYSGEDTKLGVVRALLRFYFNVDETGSLLELRQRLAERVRAEGRWGLGCPYGCGRHWEFKPSGDLKTWEPTAPELKIVGNSFRCDRCGGEIQLG